MIRSLYTSATGMIAQQKRMDVVVNNIANMETTGFKKDGLVTSSFQSILISRVGSGKVTPIGNMNLGVNIAEEYTDFSQGNMEQTDRQLDVALEGDGYFTIETPNGLRYTRDGNFKVSSDGTLVTNDGYRVLGTNGPIQVGSGEVVVDEKGNIAVDGETKGTFAISAFADNTKLQKAGNNLYVNVTNQAVLSPSDTAVKQGWLEGSNVDMATEIVEMMSVNRSYEINQRITSMLDETLDKTCNELGRV